RSKELDNASALVSGAIHRLSISKGKTGEGVIDIGRGIEKKSSVFQEPYPQPTGQASTPILDADDIIWGTEGGVFLSSYSDISDTTRRLISVINNNLKLRYVKVRIQQPSVSIVGKSFTPNICMPSQDNCRVRFNLDETARLFKANNWSMVPMLSHDPNDSNITASDIDSYVEFVDWFVSKYKNEANVRYVELVNAPIHWWKGAKEQLLELNNKVYDRVKGKYPDILIGTPGFEYMLDNPSSEMEIQQIEYFLDERNGAKFDFWAFHGYPLTGRRMTGIYPPTKSGFNNRYGGIPGILEIRKKLDANGWHNREIIDTEHTGMSGPAQPEISDETDKLDAAYTTQELLLKRTLKSRGKFVLSGIFPLKIYPKGNRGEFAWGSLKPDASLTRTVKAVSLLRSKFGEYMHSSHISGEFDNENQVWVEKFQSGKKELYIFFKPFKYQVNRSIVMDNETINYGLVLSGTPASISLTDINGDSMNVTITPSQTIPLKAVNSLSYLEVSY
ncbi:MAG TPA: hypothetical protein VI387_13500, partial [Candidatus Brocadiales bacterium]|nr:hypothetical protein [Candidatus Brocadiales bacterium]